MALKKKRRIFPWPFLLFICWNAGSVFAQQIAQPPDSTRLSTPQDSSGYQSNQPGKTPFFRFKDRYGDPTSSEVSTSPFGMELPSLQTVQIEVDTARKYTIHEKIGDIDYRPPTTMSFEEFSAYQQRQMLQNYWSSRSKSLDGESPVSGRGLIPKIYISPVLDRIFGGSSITLIPRGFVTLDFGGAWQKVNNPSIPSRQQRNGGFEFDQQIGMSVTGKVGEKLSVDANFDNNNSFDFENKMKVEYTGFKEDILQKLEIGNVSLPLNNTLVQGGQNLFGIKAQLQFGKLSVTAIASTQRGKTESVVIPGGSDGQGRPFEKAAADYDENRHFFLGQFFRDNYERWIANLPQITSGVNITRVEVYVLNRNNDTKYLRNVVGLMDLGEGRRIYNPNISSNGAALPNGNGSNTLYNQLVGLNRESDVINQGLENLYSNPALVNGTDFEKITAARKMEPTEYTYQKNLGYITLARKLNNDEVLAVAYEYTYNGQVFKVGELSEDYANLKDSEVVFLKLLRPRKISIRDQNNVILPTWDLMMKNIYWLNVSQLSREDFQLRIIYRDDKTGIDNPQLQEGINARNRQLIEIFGLDKLNASNDPQRDGNFDFVEGITINTDAGLIIFPYLEPFSDALRTAFKDEPNKDFLIQKYAYDTLYKTTKSDAELFTTKNKFFIVGKYNAGSSSEILIPSFGKISDGSVHVLSGGIPLTEGLDYAVDYTFGRVTILNQGILSSGKDLSIQYEQQDPFSFQTRSLLGSRFDYKLNDHFNFGATALYYNERPLITRNLIGTEPARNFLYGADFNYQQDSRLLTKMLDAIPGVSTKEPSAVNWSAEFAQLMPGTSNVVDGEGTSYIDDFENSATPYSLLNPNGWSLAATPLTSDNRYDPSGGALFDLQAGYKRAKLAWYQVDNQFYLDNGRYKPPNISGKDLQNHYVRAVSPNEIFPQKNQQQGVFFEQILDLAYFPTERGPYNYNPDLTSDGQLKNPEGNWGGITAPIRTEVDFDKANIEYIEFWMEDPFIPGENGKVLDGKFNQNNTTGGSLIFNLGSVSEDIMRDGKHAFENGLPPDGNLTGGGAVLNTWGYVTTQQFLTHSFNNESGTRKNQDVGLDGVPDEKEQATFQNFLNTVTPSARSLVEADPSADDFKFYFNSLYDNANAKILERYKNFNGMDGNTPIITGNDQITRQGSVTPDNEDLNDDNTLSELEEYYSYHIDLKPGQLTVGSKYVVDKIQVSPPGTGDLVTWYQFRIPVRQFEDQYGNIEGFKSVKYIRMLMTGFSQPVVLRLANFRMVGSRWRRYEGNLEEAAFTEHADPDLNNFTLSVVNIEENSQGDAAGNKSPYVVPPGFIRDHDNTSTINRELNEQSIQMCVDDLADGDARAIYKNILPDMDLFNYGRIKMFIHANSDADDDELHVFMRIGTDFDQNYYEIELPLKITKPAATNDPTAIWPADNEFDINLNDLYALKAERDRNRFPLNESYPREGPRQADRNMIRIFGRPDLSAVRVIMIGLRNPKTSDKQSFSTCLWANELRLTDFDRTPGWAVNTNFSAKLADIGTISGAARHTTFGFGAVSSKISERTREESTSYGLSANLNLDKFIPANTGLRIPMFVSYDQNTVNPNYDPANPDLRLDAALQAFNTDEEKSDYKKLIQDRSVGRSISFINVKKVKLKPDAPIRPYDIENFSFSYAYNENIHKNFFLEEDTRQQYKGGVGYNFAPKAAGVEPFKNSKGLKSPYLKLIKDFNFNLMPNTIDVRADLDRTFAKKIYRNSGFNSDPNFEKTFYFNRTYVVQWAISRGLNVSYNARANAIIDEPEGDLNTQEKKDSVIQNLKNFGRMKNFDQSITTTYTLPLSKLPPVDWVGADYRYQVNYNWKAGPVNKPDYLVKPGEQDLADSLDFKNTIQNRREDGFTAKLDMVKLYNKINLLKKINTPPRSVTVSRPQSTPQPADTTRNSSPALKGILRLLMSLRSVSGEYKVAEGTMLPGFTPTASLFGLSKGFEAPGWAFVLGSQDPAIRNKANEKNWLIRAPSLTMPFSQIKSKSMSARAEVVPFTDLRIQLNISKDQNNSYQEIFRFDEDLNDFISLNPSRNGSYKISMMSFKTAFDKGNDEVESSVFHTFEQNLDIVQQRFSNITGSDYDTISQDVLIPAFIATYTGKDARTISLSPFPKTPLPNWNIEYGGLAKMKGMKDIFQTFTISHVYQSSYGVLNFSNSLQYANADTVGINVPLEDYNVGYYGSVRNGRIVPIYIISQVVISEKFSPLIGIHIVTKSKLDVKGSYNMSRDLALNISNAQVTELNSKEIVLTIGYTKNNMKLPIKADGRTIVLKNDVTFNLTMKVSNNKTIQRKIEDLGTVTNGAVNFQLSPYVNYVVNQKLSVRMYFDRTINDPAISNSYRRANTKFGIQVRFNLSP